MAVSSRALSCKARSLIITLPLKVQKTKTEKYVIDNTVYEYAQENDEEIVNNDGVDTVPESQNGWLEVGRKNKKSGVRTVWIYSYFLSRYFARIELQKPPVRRFG